MAEKNEQFFLEKYDLTERKIDRIVAEVLGGAVEHADIYFEYTASDLVTLEDGMIKNPSSGVIQGAGVRAISGEKTGYAVTEKLHMRTLKEAAAAARYIARHAGESSRSLPARIDQAHNLYDLRSSPYDTPLSSRVELLKRIDEVCRAYDPRICQVFANIGIQEKRVLIAGRDGRLIADVRPLVRLDIMCIAEENGRRERGSSGTGGRIEFEWLLLQDWYLMAARDAARQAILNLSVVDAPAGKMDVVLGPGWPGILLHEAVGHGLEGDFNRMGISKFSGKIGQKVASELCTVVDDGTISNRRGSLNTDDEGTPTQRNVLIENGILVGYMQDLLNAKLMNVRETGNGRRESYAHIPMPRMTNTIMLAGQTPPEDIIHSVKRGIYAVAFGGGQVDITNGDFVFNMTEAYLIENGKTTKPIRGATLIGNGPDAMQNVSMVGNNLELDHGIGTCGKNGQTVPVGVGLPTIRIEKEGITVGGTAQEGGK
ncbi:MAG: metalloprotease TldD [Candidatus Sungbacteria bacterium]|nr:metalloprotease TldD [Candidatus Sungbacteria bacterium]